MFFSPTNYGQIVKLSVILALIRQPVYEKENSEFKLA